MGRQLGTDDLYWSALGVPEQSATIWTSECSYTPVDRITARVVPDQTTGLVMAASGTPTSSTAIELQAQTGGVPGADGVRLVWREAGETDWMGWVPPTRPTWYTQPIGTERGQHPRVVSRGTGNGLVVVYEQSATIRARTYDTSTQTWSSAVTVHTAYDLPANYTQHPTPVVLDDGTVLVLSYRYEAGSVGVQVHASEDGGATWAMWSESTIEAIGDSPLRLSAAAANGQILIVAEWEDAYVPTGAVYASADGGQTWTLVEQDLADTRHKTVVAAGGVFLLAYVLDDANSASTVQQPYVARTANAFAPFGAPTAVGKFLAAAPGSGSSLDEAVPDVALAVEEGAVWLYLTPASATAVSRAYRSNDLGQTWQSLPDGADRVGAIWWYGTTSAYPWSISAAYHEGAVWLASNRRSAAGSSRHDVVSLMTYGGWQTVTFPRKAGIPNDVGVPTWTQSWRPFDALDHASTGWTFTGGGSGPWNTALSANAEYHAASGTSSGDSLAFAATGGGQLADAAARVDLHLVAGVQQMTLTIGTSGGVSYAVKAQLDSSGNILVVDPNNPDSPTAISGYTGRVQVLLTVGRYAPTGLYYGIVWVSADTGPHVRWTMVRNRFLTAGSATVGGMTLITSGSGAAPSVRYYGVDEQWTSTSPAALVTGPGLVRVYKPGSEYAPTAPYGRSLPGVRPVYFGNGVAFRGSGQARPGQTWSMTPAETWGPDRCLATEWPMPGDTFRCTGAGALAWQFGADGIRVHTPAWWLWLESNAAQWSLEWHDGTSWVSAGTIDARLELPFERQGRSIVGEPTGALTDRGPFIDQGELVGGYVDMAGDVREIVRQASGTRETGDLGNTTARTKRLHLEINADGTEATSGTAYIRPPRMLVLLRVPEYLATPVYGLRITPQDTGTAEGYWEFKALCGPLYMVRRPSWGSRLQVEHRNEENEALDGRWESTELAPPRVVWTGGWQEPMSRVNVQGDSASPDARSIRVTDDTADQYTSFPLGYADGELAGQLRGLLAELRGSATPVVWVPTAPRIAFEGWGPLDGSSWPWQTFDGGLVASVQRQAGGIYGVIVSDLDVTHHTGEEGVSDAVRVGTLEIRELR